MGQDYPALTGYYAHTGNTTNAQYLTVGGFCPPITLTQPKFYTSDPLSPYYFVREEEEKPTMRGLYEVFLVNPKTADLEWSTYVVANDEKNATIKALSIHHFEGDLDDYDVITRLVGSVRAKKEVKSVKVVKDE